MNLALLLLWRYITLRRYICYDKHIKSPNIFSTKPEKLSLSLTVDKSNPSQFLYEVGTTITCTKTWQNCMKDNKMIGENKFEYLKTSMAMACYLCFQITIISYDKDRPDIETKCSKKSGI